MNVGIDISAIPFGTGVSRYSSNLVRALLPQLSPEDTLTCFGSSLRQRDSLNTFIQSLKNESKVVSKTYFLPPSLLTLLFNQLNTPITAFTGPVDVYHAWDWYTPNPGESTLVSTIHDVALFKFPQIAHPHIKKHHELSLNRIKKLQAHLVSVSEATKKDVIELFSINPELIHVIPSALPIESQVVPLSANVDYLKKKWPFKKPYLLFVGTKEPRKNLTNQIKAWQIFKKEYDFVIVGRDAWDHVTQEEGIYHLGYVDGAELAALYRNASILMYVSQYEGFGLPILEGFYHQIPVVTGNGSGMAEVAGDAAALADPYEPESIRNAINQALQLRDEYVKKGLSRLNDFSWEKTAQKTLSLYRDIMKL